MRMPFGPHRGTELDQVPDATLFWIDNHFDVEPGENVAPEKRDEYRMRNLQLKQEARRILKERRQNGVKVTDPPGTNRSRSKTKRRRF